MASPPRNDAWEPYTDVRFVLIRRHGTLKPARGFVLTWAPEHGANRGLRRTALLVMIDENDLRPAPKLEWHELREMVPVDVDPNWSARW